MTKEHPNLVVLAQLNIRDLDACVELFSDNFVWHYFNPNLPDIEGDYVRVEGLQRFFGILSGKTSGTFKVEPISAMPIGEELIVVHTRNTMALEDNSIKIDVVVVWRVVEGKITEGWDIPSAFTMAA